MAKAAFILRADSRIGSGHLVRSSRLAKAMKEWNVTFITPPLPENLEKFTAGFASATIEKWEDIPSILRDLRPDLTVVDCYELDESFENLCLPYTRRLAVIDDLHNRRHSCHILIAGSLTASEDEYRPLVPPSAKLRLAALKSM